MGTPSVGAVVLPCASFYPFPHSFSRFAHRLATGRNFFFQPLDLHLEPADLLVKLGLNRLALVVVVAAAVLEQGFDAVQESLLPLADLDGVDLEGPRQLRKGSGLLGGLQSDPSLEGCRMSLLCACHDAPRDGTVIFDQFNIPSGPVLGVHLTA